MINEETIKSLYNDKPTLLEWLKRVEAQLEELKKITNFDTLTANNVEVNQKLFVKGNPVAKAIYVHKISWKYTNAVIVFKYYLSTKPTPYSSMADIFSHKNDTSLNASEVVEYGSQSGAIVKFSPTGDVLSAVAIGVSNGSVSTFAMAPNAFDFVKDEVIGGWGV